MKDLCVSSLFSLIALRVPRGIDYRDELIILFFTQLQKSSQFNDDVSTFCSKICYRRLRDSVLLRGNPIWGTLISSHQCVAIFKSIFHRNWRQIPSNFFKDENFFVTVKFFRFWRKFWRNLGFRTVVTFGWELLREMKNVFVKFTTALSLVNFFVKSGNLSGFERTYLLFE